MKVQISSNDNGSGMSSLLTISADYNPQNKVFNNSMFCIIDEDDFIGCFAEDKQDKVIEQMQEGKIIFDVNKNSLIDNCKKLF